MTIYILKDQVLFIQSNMQTSRKHCFLMIRMTHLVCMTVSFEKGQRDSLYADAIDINILTESFKTRSAIRIVEKNIYTQF